jgi:hypothetical protein
MNNFAVPALITLALIACLPTPKQESAIVDGACTIVEAYSDSPAAEAICATAEELTVIANAARSARVDAGPGVRLAPCKIIPTTTTCATDKELLPAIRYAVYARGK